MKTRVLRKLNVVFIVVEMTIKQTMTDAFILFTVIVQPFLVAVMGLWMLRDKGPDYGIYVVVGSGMTGLWSALLYISGNSINAERWAGTLESLVGMPEPLSTIVFAKNIANVLQSLFSMLTTYILASFLFGYPLSVAHPLLFSVSLFLTVLAFIAFGLVLAPVYVINPSIQHWQNGFEFPVYVISGFLFPVLMLPVWTLPVSWILPTYWAARAIHATAEGGVPKNEIFLSWAALLASSVVCFAIASRLFRMMLNKARRDATLDME